MGDSSNDGHGRTKSIMIDSNISANELYKSYNLGCNILGFDLIKEVAANYNDHSISKEYFEEMIRLGYNDSFCDPEYLDDESFVDLFLFIVKLGNSNFTYTIIYNIPYIDIGGYGLFQ